MALHNYLIRGLSGTGKSSVCLELIRRGYTAIDADDHFAYLEKPSITLLSGKRIPEVWNWDTDKLTGILNNKEEHIVFICGGATNEDQFMAMFEKVITLSIDNDTMTERLLNRINNNYRNRLDELAQQVEWNKLPKEHVKDTIIDAMRPLNAVVDEVIEHTLNNIN